MKQNNYHEPVLIKEITEVLNGNASKDLKVVDATLGTAGHTSQFLLKGWKVLGIEADKNMLEISKERLESEFNKDKYILENDNFRNIDRIVKKHNFSNPDSILFDLGVSNLQLTSKERGFSFSNPDSLLDMRIDATNQQIKASELLNVLREDQLERLFEKVLDKGLSRILAKKVIEFRTQKKFETVGEFNQICEFLPGKKAINKATLPYLALRIAVNSELENLSEALPKAFEILKKNGKLLAISFHSGEDRIVKDYFKSLEDKGLAKLFTMIRPGEEEIEENPRSRSAKLRYLIKL